MQQAPADYSLSGLLNNRSCTAAGCPNLCYLLKLTDSQFENARIKVKNAKLWNPDVAGMAISIMVLCFITIYYIRVYVDSWQ
jgi:hypothetical protein